jgi:hypothetical protein
MTEKYLGTDALFDEIRDEIEDMSNYLETDTLRRQANTVVRLTVVTAFGLIGTVATGFLGMNLYALSDLSTWEKFAVFIAVLVPVTALTLYTIVKSKSLSNFLEAVSDDGCPRAKLASFLDAILEARPANRREASMMARQIAISAARRLREAVNRPAMQHRAALHPQHLHRHLRDGCYPSKSPETLRPRAARGGLRALYPPLHSASRTGFRW